MLTVNSLSSVLYLFHTIKSDSRPTVTAVGTTEIIYIYIYTHSITYNKYFVIVHILFSIKIYIQINKETVTYCIHGFCILQLTGTVVLKTFFP
jgi:hypothetical protein